MKYSDLHLKFDESLSAKDWHSSITLVNSDPAKIERLTFGTAPTAMGLVTIFWQGGLLFYVGLDEDRSLVTASRLFPHADMVRDDKMAATWAERMKTLWAGQKPDAPLHLGVYGTDFQRAVWAALMRIPKGHVVSYGTVAAAIGRPRAVRAVGSAVGANPMTLLIPCHRVIQRNGSVINYEWGDAAKQRILKIEAAA